MTGNMHIKHSEYNCSPKDNGNQVGDQQNGSIAGNQGISTRQGKSDQASGGTSAAAMATPARVFTTLGLPEA